MPRRTQVRAIRVVNWIERYCVVPSGERKGQHVQLTLAERDTIRKIYDGGQDVLSRVTVTGPLAAYLALLHICGPEAPEHTAPPPLDIDIFSVWSAVGPDLLPVLQRENGRIVCPQLGTEFSVAA